MIVRQFYIKEMELGYFVGINQVTLDVNHLLENNRLTDEKDVLNYLFKVIQEIQDNNEGSVIQIINDKFVVSPDHIYIACYHLQKAFFHKTYISNKKNIEFLLYLSTYRQINKAFDAFGVNLNDLRNGSVLICIISPIDNVTNINNEILKVLPAKETELTISNITSEKIRGIIKNYDLLDSQIKSVLESYKNKMQDIKEIDDNVEVISTAVLDLIYEKMALLSLEKIKSH